jgi:hypothetical protein
MTTTTQQNVKIEQAFSIFNENQIEAIKLIIREGFWGDCGERFADNKIYSANGYYTNMNKGKQFSGIMSSVSKTIKSSETNLILMISDWWQNGRGDMMFFNMDLIDETELENWANNN